MIRSQGERKLGEWWPQAGEGCVRGGGKGSHRKGGMGGIGEASAPTFAHFNAIHRGELFLFPPPNTSIFSLRV